MWLSVLPQILFAVFLLLAPGLLVSAALGFRAFDALGLAPVLSVGLIVAASTASPLVGVSFGIVPVGIVAALVASAGFLLARRGQRRRAVPGAARWQAAPFLALAIAAGLLAWRTVQVVGSPGSISQTYDAVFHLNAVRFALDTGQASSLTVGQMTGGGFYPAGWNAVAAVVASATGTEVAVAVNITTLILASVFWPLSCLLLVRWIVGSRMSATIAAGIACASLGAFPLLMMDFGVLYPNLLAISILPACIALAARITGASNMQAQPNPPFVLALLLGLTGLVVSHPTTLVAWFVWTLPMAGLVVYRTAPRLWKNRSGRSLHFKALLAGVLAYCLVFAVVWLFLRPPEEAAFWGPYHTVPQALGEAVFLAPMNLAPAWLVAPLALLGLWSCLRQPLRIAWVAVPFIIFSAIFVVVAGFPISPLRNFLAGVWYNDSYRVAALLPVAAIPLAAVGVNWAETQLRSRGRTASVDRLVARFNQGEPVAVRRLAPAGLSLLTLAAIVLGQQGGMQHEAAQASTRYALNHDSPLVSADELALLERLPDKVPADAVLVGNPYTGAALSYALAGRRAAQLHILSYVSPELQEIYNDLDEVATDPDVCTAVRSEKAFFALDFGGKEVHGGNHTPPGLRNLDRNPGVQLVDSQGDARLYRITSCGI